MESSLGSDREDSDASLSDSLDSEESMSVLWTSANRRPLAFSGKEIEDGTLSLVESSLGSDGEAVLLSDSLDSDASLSVLWT